MTYTSGGFVEEEIITIAADELAAACELALRSLGTPDDIADLVARSLVASEVADVPSHGVLRLKEYLHEARTGVLDVKARPQIRAPSSQVRIVDGRCGFGVLAAQAVVENLCDLLDAHTLCAVALTNAGHIGRLADVGRPVALRRGAVLGFVNYLGGGQRVVPWQGRDGRLCTNPLLVAVPAHPEPFVLDMSTSTVSEGKIRERWLTGLDVPSDWLVDADGGAVNDPARLYSDPPTAFMTPLGGSHGYKGFGLGIAVELLAGVVTGAGFAQPGVDRRGNGGLFIGLTTTLAGRAQDEVLHEAGALRAHLLSSATAVRWPGDRSAGAVDADAVRINQRVWAEILRYARGKDAW